MEFPFRKMDRGATNPATWDAENQSFVLLDISQGVMQGTNGRDNWR